MLTLSGANDLLKPFLQHPDYEELEQGNERLKFLVKEIEVKLQDIERNSFPGSQLIRLDETLEACFREFAQICEENLS